MKRIARYWLLASFGAFAACAITIWFLLPFKPRATFTSPQIAFYSDSNGTGYPEVSTTLRNDGRFPIWYYGTESSIEEFTIEGDPQKGERHHHSCRYLSWNAIAPGETVTVPLPVYDLFDNAKIAVKLRDWRGREVICSTKEFDFSSVPVEGIAGLGVKPLAPIPQKN